MPLAVKFFLAFVIVLGLLGLFWLVVGALRRFGAGRLGGANARGRQPRLAVTDHASVDGRRRLILVRRDNIEHLLMVGGPTDIVVEANIVRGAPAARDVTLPRAPAVADALPRGLPAGADSGNGAWPLQPEHAAAARSAPRVEPASEEPVSWPMQPPPESPARPARESLAALADEIASRPVPPPRARANAPSRPPQAELRPEPRLPAGPHDTEAIAAADQSLAEMAQRLEAALRKPKGSAEARTPAAAGPRPIPSPEPMTESDTIPIPPPPPSRPARAEPKPSQSKALYDSLEQEMASLLGRPAGKT